MVIEKKVYKQPPDKKLFAYLERKYGVGHIEYLGPIGHDGADMYFCIKPDRSGGEYYTSHPSQAEHLRAVEYTGILKDLRERILENEQMKVRDQGKRNTSAAMAGAYANDLRKVGRTMNSKANDALVIGDGSEVYSEWEERRKEDPELPSEPDQIDYDDYWDSVYEATGALVRERDEAAYKLNRNISDWYCEVSNFGWRSQRGAKVFGVEGGDAPDHAIGTEFLHNILPKTDCTFYIYDDLDGAGLKIDNAHHDAPTGGEWYHCAPLAWMMMNGMWTGIQNDSDEIIPEIQEVLLMEWEHEFLDKELAEYSGQPNKSHLGNRAALDIEFSRLYKKFLARYKVVPTDNYLEELKNDLQVFFERYYASNTLDEWEDYLNGCDMEGFNAELKTFLEFYKMTPEEVAPIDLGEMKQMYESVLSDLHQD